LTLPWIYQHYHALEAYLSSRSVGAAFCLHLREGFIFTSPSYQRLDSLSSDLLDSYTYHMSTVVDLGTLHRRLRRGRKPGQQPEGTTLPSIQTVVRFLQLRTITPFTRVYAYYGPFSACYLSAAVAFWHIHRAFRPLGCLTAFLVHHLLGWLDRLDLALALALITSAYHRTMRLISGISARHTLLEVHEGLRAMLTGVCKEIPHGFQA
jgi:hypothetical protein